MTNKNGLPTASNPMPIACTLTPEQLPSQLAEWSALRAAVTDRRDIDGGVRLTMPADRATIAHDLAAREQGCCSFLRIDVRVDDVDCVMDITSEHPDAEPVIALIARGEGTVTDTACSP